MYEYKGLQDIFFVMLYGGATLLAVMACLYLLLTRGNMFSSAINPPKALRRWTAAFMASVAASHVWWVMLGMYWLTDDRLTRNIVAITLDRLTFVPLMMVVLLRMLQDRRRPLWPVFVAMIPFAVTAVVSLVKHNNDFEWFIEIYSILLALVFTVYFVFAVRQYGRWLHENFADLEHKEVWQSLLLLAFILLVFMAYASNGGALGTEYLAQINTLIIITFILWRVETLQQLDAMESSEASEESEESAVASNANNIGALLELHCEATRLYLQHDLTLQQLAIATALISATTLPSRASPIMPISTACVSSTSCVCILRTGISYNLPPLPCRHNRAASTVIPPSASLSRNIPAPPSLPG